MQSQPTPSNSFFPGLYPRFDPERFVRAYIEAWKTNPLTKRIWSAIRLYVFLIIPALFIPSILSFLFYQLVGVRAGGIVISAFFIILGMLLSAFIKFVLPVTYGIWCYRRFYLNNPEVQLLPYQKSQLFLALSAPLVIANLINGAVGLGVTVLYSLSYLFASFGDAVMMIFAGSSILGRLIGILELLFIFLVMVMRAFLLAQERVNTGAWKVSLLAPPILCFLGLLVLESILQRLLMHLSVYLTVFLPVVMICLTYVVSWQFWRADSARAAATLFQASGN